MMKDKVRELLEPYARQSFNMGEGKSFLLYSLTSLIIFTFIMSVFSPLVSALLTGRLVGILSAPEAVFTNGLYLTIAAILHEVGHRQTARHYGLRTARFRVFLFNGAVDYNSDASDVTNHLTLLSLIRITAAGLIVTLLAAATAIFLGLYYKPLLIGAGALGLLGIENLFPGRDSDGKTLYRINKKVWFSLLSASIILLVLSILMLIR